jgi:dTDP-4-amino-4,6-dideoxygalactose transaminase
VNQQIPLVRPYLPALGEIVDDLSEMLDSGRLTNFGPFSVRLEREVEAILGVRHVAAVSSATTGLCLLLNTLPVGSEVIVPSFTFIATVQAIIWNRLTPVFADIQPDTLNVCPRSVESHVTPRTSAILAVHAFGSPCYIEELHQIAKKHHTMLFFDSAHAFGSKHQGVHVGSFGDAEVFSLNATKVVSSGEGGLVTTNWESLYDAILDRRNYGLNHNGSRDCSNPGLNGKLPEFSAILALKEVASLAWRLERRNEIAHRYLHGLRGLPGLRFQTVRDGDLSTYKDFTIQVDQDSFGVDRNRLQVHLANGGIETAPYFWPPIHRMTYFRPYLKPDQNLVQTDIAADRILSLPMFETLSDDDIERVVISIADLARSQLHRHRFHDTALRLGA